jgi:hypothetical protein
MNRKRTPPGAPVQTFAQVAAWIKARVDVKDNAHKTPRRAALWFFAYREAEAMCDYRLRDFAELVLGGMKPMTVAGIEEQLRYDVKDDSTFDLTAELVEFWQVPA